MEIATGRRLAGLQELLGLHDEAFVRRAYQLVLGREADKGGLSHSVARLRDGDDRLAVLASLRLSAEARELRMVFPELDVVIKPYRSAFHPRWGRVLKTLRLTKRTRPEQRTINRLENRLARVGGGEPTDFLTPAPTINIDSLPSRKITGNVAVAAQIWSHPPEIERILLLKLDHFGDFFVAIRAFSLIRKAWPKAHITLVCGSWNVRFAQRLGLFDQVLAFDMAVMLHRLEPEQKIGWIEQCKGIKALSLQRYDLAVDLRHDLDTRPCLLFIEAAFKGGYETDLPRPWPQGVSPLNIALHQSDLHAELRCTLLAQLVVTTLQPPEQHPITELARAGETDLPFAPGTYFVVAPGAAARNRMWPPARFGELLRLVRGHAPCPIVLVGSTADRVAAMEIATSLPEGSYADLCGTPFEDLPWIFANAAMFIGCDSGPGHLAALLGTPTLSIYGGVSAPRIWQPLGPHVAIVHSRTPCAYCHDRVCAYDFRCMNEITVQDVFLQFKTLFASIRPPHTVHLA